MSASAVAHAGSAKAAPAAPRARPAVSAPAVDSLADACGNRGLQRTLAAHHIRPQLKVGAVDDPAEREADDAAERVMSGASAQVAARPDASASADQECSTCASIHRDADGPAPAALPASVPRALGGAGQALDAPTRLLLEPAYGHDFSAVRVHIGTDAAQSASDLRAHAFTQGRDIVFGGGEYQPETPTGRRLLAHELAHVVQGGAAIRRDALPAGVALPAAGTNVPAPASECRAPEPAEPVCRAEPPAAAWEPPEAGSEIVEFRGYTLSTDAAYVRYTLAQIIAAVGFDGAEMYVALLDQYLQGIVDTNGQYDAHGTPMPDPTASPEGYVRVLQIVPILRDALPILRADYERFTALVLSAAVLRLKANERNLGLWTDYVAGLSPTRVMGQALVEDEQQTLLRYTTTLSKVPENPMQIYERRTQERSPFMRDYADALVDGRINGGCQQCHSQRTAVRLTLEHPPETMGVLGFTPLQRLRPFAEAEQRNPSADPGLQGATPAQVPAAVRQRTAGLPGATAVADSIDAIRSRLAPLGEQGYRVLPTGVMNTAASAPELVAEVLSHIDARRLGYRKLIGRINSGDAQYLEFQELLQYLLPAAQPLTAIMVHGDITRKQQADEAHGTLEGVLTVATLLLSIFPPTAPLGIAMGVGTAAYGAYQGYEQFQQGVRFVEGIGADIYTREQQDAARTMQLMGVLTIAMSTLDIGLTAWDVIKVIREAGVSGRIIGAEARAGNKVAKVSGLDGANPSVVISGGDDAARVTSVGELGKDVSRLSDEATAATRVGAELSHSERALLERNRLVNSPDLPLARAEGELRLVGRRKAEPLPEGGDYIAQVRLENGHVWKRRADGRWCRFSNDPKCFLGDPWGGVHGYADDLPEGTHRIVDDPNLDDTLNVAHADALGASLEKAGMSRPDLHEPHHVVPSSDPRGMRAKEILEDAGIGVDDATNGVWLPRTTRAVESERGLVSEAFTSHDSIHTNRYFEALTERLEHAQALDRVYEEMEAIRMEIHLGTFPF